MTTPIFRHGEWEENYDDPSHPIPAVGALDVQGIKHSGGADLSIIVASPLKADEYSKSRLKAKIAGYLAYIRSDEYVEACSPPTKRNTTIVVHMHRDSDFEAFDLLDAFEGTARHHHGTPRAPGYFVLTALGLRQHAAAQRPLR